MLDFFLKKNIYCGYPWEYSECLVRSQLPESDSNDEIQQQVLIVHHDTRKAPKSKCTELHMNLNPTQKPA